MQPFLQAVKREMALQFSIFNFQFSTPPDTLYIGGGTPSLCGAEELGELIIEAKRLWKCEFKEVTVEMNPEDVTNRYCETLAQYGVNRLSLGIQSFFDTHLRLMNRRHNAAQGIKAVEAARTAGYKNISIDLIFGFPGLSPSQWKYNIEQALALRPEHISAYQLGIEVGTPFYRMMQQGRLQPVSQEEAASQYALLRQRLPAAGWEHYEISNFARKGFRSRHNSAYWQGVPYLGLGPSAHSYNGVARHANVRHLGRYLKAIDAAQALSPPTWGQSGICLIEAPMTHKKRYNEFIMTRLRTAEGFTEHSLIAFMTPWCTPRFIKKMERHLIEAATPLLQKGWLVRKGESIRIPPQKWFVSDGIIVALMM